MNTNNGEIPLPTHVAIIMDGNRRWAKQRHFPVIEGHRRVADGILETLVEHASNRGIKYLTFWAWSTENWKRNEEEVSGIMGVFRHVIQRKWQKLHENGVCIKVIGKVRDFDQDIQDALKAVVEQTKNNSKITAIFALNYGGRDEIIRAINAWHQGNKDDIKDLTPEVFNSFLDTSGIPDPDLIIRTGGEQRLSGFLLWQSEYSELYFPSWTMPEFTPEKFDEALEEYQQRKRNFGK